MKYMQQKANYSYDKNTTVAAAPLPPPLPPLLPLLWCLFHSCVWLMLHIFEKNKMIQCIILLTILFFIIFIIGGGWW